MEDNISNALLMAAAMLIFIIAITVTFSLISQTKTTSDIILYSYDDTKYYDQGYEDITYTLADEKKFNRIVNIETIMPTVYRYIKENYGVTIIKKDGTILARFDSTTESVVNKWQNYLNIRNTESQGYKTVSTFYNDLIQNLKSVDIYETDNNGNISLKTIELKWNEINTYSEDFSYKSLTPLWKRIYHQTGGANNIQYGAPFAGKPIQIARRLDADFGGGNVEFNSGTTYYGVGGTDGLLEKYKNKNFQEVFVFVSDDEGVVTDDETGDSVITKANTTKLEIIYVMEE